MSLVVAAVATAGVIIDPTNSYRVGRSVCSVARGVATGTRSIVNGVYFREAEFIQDGATKLGGAALATVDTAVYTAAVAIPFIPVGFFWEKVRGQG